MRKHGDKFLYHVFYLLGVLVGTLILLYTTIPAELWNRLWYGDRE
jgi:hypothetical protein